MVMISQQEPSLKMFDVSPNGFIGNVTIVLSPEIAKKE